MKISNPESFIEFSKLEKIIKGNMEEYFNLTTKCRKNWRNEEEHLSIELYFNDNKPGFEKRVECSYFKYENESKIILIMDSMWEEPKILNFLLGLLYDKDNYIINAINNKELALYMESIKKGLNTSNFIRSLKRALKRIGINEEVCCFEYF